MYELAGRERERDAERAARRRAELPPLDARDQPRAELIGCVIGELDVGDIARLVDGERHADLLEILDLDAERALLRTHVAALRALALLRGHVLDLVGAELLLRRIGALRRLDRRRVNDRPVALDDLRRRLRGGAAGIARRVRMADVLWPVAAVFC